MPEQVVGTTEQSQPLAPVRQVFVVPGSPQQMGYEPLQIADVAVQSQPFEFVRQVFAAPGAPQQMP